MPYITPENREKFKDSFFPKLLPIDTAGDLNYLITSLCHRYLALKGTSYTTLNEVVGVLACAQLELYRRVVVPYEDAKIQENGDVKP